jgi:hypothetical protein
MMVRLRLQFLPQLSSAYPKGRALRDALHVEQCNIELPRRLTAIHDLISVVATLSDAARDLDRMPHPFFPIVGSVAQGRQALRNATGV